MPSEPGKIKTLLVRALICATVFMTAATTTTAMNSYSDEHRNAVTSTQLAS